MWLASTSWVISPSVRLIKNQVRTLLNSGIDVVTPMSLDLTWFSVWRSSFYFNPWANLFFEVFTDKSRLQRAQKKFRFLNLDTSRNFRFLTVNQISRFLFKPRLFNVSSLHCSSRQAAAWSWISMSAWFALLIRDSVLWVARNTTRTELHFLLHQWL